MASPETKIRITGDPKGALTAIDKVKGGLTGLSATADELAEHTHLDLEPVVDAARQLNPPFFMVRAWQAEQILARHALALASARQTQPAPH